MFSSSAFFFSTWEIMVFFSVRTLKIFILVPNMINSTLLAPLNLTLYLSFLYLLWVLLIDFHCYIVKRLISPVCWMLLAKVKMMNTHLSLPVLLTHAPNTDNLNLVVETFPLWTQYLSVAHRRLEEVTRENLYGNSWSGSISQPGKKSIVRTNGLYAVGFI